MGEIVSLDRRPIGEIVKEDYHDKLYFVKHRVPRHYFKIFGGFGFSLSVIDRLIEKGVEEIRLIYHGETQTKVFKITPENVLNKGKPYFNQPDDKQFIVNENDFDEVVS